MASTYGQRPSQILEINDSWLAYQVDLACLTFGRWVEGKLGERNKKGRPIHRIEQLLADEPSTGQFRSARWMATRKERVGPDGTW